MLGLLGCVKQHDAKDVEAKSQAQKVATAQNEIDTTKEALRQGGTFLDNGNFDAAISACTEAIRLDAKNAEAFWGRGRAYMMKGDMDKAIADFTEAIRLNPRHALAYNESIEKGMKIDEIQHRQRYFRLVFPPKCEYEDARLIP